MIFSQEVACSARKVKVFGNPAIGLGQSVSGLAKSVTAAVGDVLEMQREQFAKSTPNSSSFH